MCLRVLLTYIQIRYQEDGTGLPVWNTLEIGYLVRKTVCNGGASNCNGYTSVARGKRHLIAKLCHLRVC
eukprot:XP_001704900.1 Hypothetical protein GL50803_37286 [Giardia lamblia ATCC 50803]